jgi:hypothetical protein
VMAVAPERLAAPVVPERGHGRARPRLSPAGGG